MEYEIFRGRRAIAGWAEKVKKSQEITHYTFSDGAYPRIRYRGPARLKGHPKPDPNLPCGDCWVIKGEFHVPGCDMERCPRCRGQALSCDCPAVGVEVV